MVSCHKGMTCELGPAGVGRAVNQSVVTTFLLIFAANYVITTLYFVLVPQRI
jgi:phospholipid/cholesterol/gamma-HCH transport system permease protein